MENILKTRRQIADHFAVKPVTVKKWQQAGIIHPCMRINGRPRYTIESVTEYLTFKTTSNDK
jgi:predicted site-specific integrase-resolvase